MQPTASTTIPATGHLPSADAVLAGLRALAHHHRVDEDLLGRVWKMTGAHGFAADAAPSAICGDGVPFELSVAMSGGEEGLRWVGEGGRGATPSERLASARGSLPALLDLLGLAGEEPPAIVDRFIPEPPDTFPPLRFGIWVTPVLSEKRKKLKVYVNTGWRGMEEALERVRDAARCLKRDRALERLSAMRPLLRGFHRLSFVAVEAGPEGVERMKLYFRGATLHRETIDTAVRLAGDASPILGDLWERFTTGRELGPEDALLSITLPAADLPLPVKIDFGTGRLGLDRDDLSSLILRVATHAGLATDSYLTTLQVADTMGTTPARHTVIGLSTHHGTPRINVYLKPGRT